MPKIGKTRKIGLCHFLTLIDLYLHAKNQKNPMFQFRKKYGWTDRQTDRQTDEGRTDGTEFIRPHYRGSKKGKNQTGTRRINHNQKKGKRYFDIQTESKDCEKIH